VQLTCANIQHPQQSSGRQQGVQSRQHLQKAESAKGAGAGVLRRKHTRCRAAAYLMQQQQQL
jgi:hypothetical protein